MHFELINRVEAKIFVIKIFSIIPYSEKWQSLTKQEVDKGQKNGLHGISHLYKATHQIEITPSTDSRENCKTFGHTNN